MYINQKNRIAVPKLPFDPTQLDSPDYRFYAISEMVAFYQRHVHGKACSLIVHAFTTDTTRLYLEPVANAESMLSQCRHIRGNLFRLSGFVLASQRWDALRINLLTLGRRVSLLLPRRRKARVIPPDGFPTL